MNPQKMSSYSEFFRNSLTYAVLEHIIIPSIKLKMNQTGRHELRVWSAACSKGQEPYSISMLLSEIAENNGGFNFRIFATDNNKNMVSAAKKGKFSFPELNGINLKRLDKWFVKAGTSYSLKPEITDKVSFSVFDLFDDRFGCPSESIFGEFDIVICANILFYFDDANKKKIINKAAGCLSKEGYFITGEVERETVMQNGFYEVYQNSAIFKSTKGER